MNPLTPAPNTRGHDPERMVSLLAGLAVGTALLLLFLWWKAHTQLATAVLAIQDVELEVIGLFTHRYDALHRALRQAHPAEVSAHALWTLCTITGEWLRWPGLVVILALAGVCLTRAPREQHRKRFGLDGLQQALVRIYPLGAAWPGRALPLVDPAPPAKSLRPMDPALRRDEWTARHLGSPIPAGSKPRARAVLARQLGRPWAGLDGLNDVETILFFALSLFLRRQKDEAQSVLDDLALALARDQSRGAPEKAMAIPKRCRDALQRRLKTADLSEALEIASKHGWTRPALMTLLQMARLRCGVLNPGLFAVIQLIDRDLWLVLSGISYPRHGLPLYLMSTTACLEASAAIEHWTAECARGAPIAEPQILSTLDALELA